MNNNKSFFTTMQNYVIAGLSKMPDQNMQSPWGRYLAICLREILQENKKLFNKLFNFDANKNTKVVLEYYYTTDRSADMALLDKDGSICALIEIKVEDKLRKGQLESYLKYAKKHKINFFLITRWLPENKVVDLIKKARGKIVTISDIHKTVEKSITTHKQPLSRMFCDFLKESRMAYEAKISEDLSFLAQKVFFSSKKDNRVSINKLRDGGPGSFTVIFTNLEIITRDLMERWEIKERKLSLNMWFQPYSAGEKLNQFKKGEKTFDDDYYSLKGEGVNLIDAGEIWFCSTINIGSSSRVYCTLEFGLVLEIYSDAKKSDLSIYWQINPDKQAVTYGSEKIKLFSKDKAWKLPSKEKFVEKLEKGFSLATRKYKKKYPNKKSQEAKCISCFPKIIK